MAEFLPPAPPPPELAERSTTRGAAHGPPPRPGAFLGEAYTDSLDGGFDFSEPSETWEMSAAANCVPCNRVTLAELDLPPALVDLGALTLAPTPARGSVRRRATVPLPALVAGVALCSNVVREPVGTDPAHLGRWAGGATAAERLFARARQSHWGTALAPRHAELTVGMFPAPWRKLGRAWMGYASNACALQPRQSEAILAALAELRGSRVVPPGYRFASGDQQLWVGWTLRLCDQLLMGYYRNFCGGHVPVGPPTYLALQQDAAAGPVEMDRFSAQVFAFGYYGRRALYTFGSRDGVWPEPVAAGATSEAVAADAPPLATEAEAHAGAIPPSRPGPWDGETRLGPVRFGESASSPRGA